MAEKVPELSPGEFDNFIKKGIVLIDFFAELHMSCMMMIPILEDLSDKFKNKIKFGKIDVGENQEIAQKFNVNFIPNFILFKDGKVIEQFVGSINEEDFINKLQKFIE